jgi:hypothetical protein
MQEVMVVKADSVCTYNHTRLSVPLPAKKEKWVNAACCRTPTDPFCATSNIDPMVASEMVQNAMIVIGTPPQKNLTFLPSLGYILA